MLQARRPFVGSSIGGCSATATEARARSPAWHTNNEAPHKMFIEFIFNSIFIVVNELSGPLPSPARSADADRSLTQLRNSLRLRLAQRSRGVERLEIGPSGRPLFYTVRIARASAAGRWRLRHWQASVSGVSPVAASHPVVSWTAAFTFAFESGPDDRTLLRSNLRLAIRISSCLGGMCRACICMPQ